MVPCQKALKRCLKFQNKIIRSTDQIVQLEFLSARTLNRSRLKQNKVHNGKV